MLPSGDYLLCIAQTSTRATINNATMQHAPTLLAILMAVAVRQYYTARIARWRRFMAFIKGTKRHHRASTCSGSINLTCLPLILGIFHRQIVEKGLELP
jgi:hypothetical protein